MLEIVEMSRLFVQGPIAMTGPSTCLRKRTMVRVRIRFGKGSITVRWLVSSAGGNRTVLTHDGPSRGPQDCSFR